MPSLINQAEDRLIVALREVILRILQLQKVTKSQLALALRVDRRTVHAWLCGEVLPVRRHLAVLLALEDGSLTIKHRKGIWELVRGPNQSTELPFSRLRGRGRFVDPEDDEDDEENYEVEEEHTEDEVGIGSVLTEMLRPLQAANDLIKQIDPSTLQFVIGLVKSLGIDGVINLIKTFQPPPKP